MAAPLFNLRERDFNISLATMVGQHFDVFLPQRDGSLLVDMVDAGVSLEVAQQRVFLQDCEAMKRSSLLVAVLDGAHVDEGVAYEIGFANALSIPCVGFQSDVRRALPTGNNPMIQCALAEIFSDTESLSFWLDAEFGEMRPQIVA